MVDETVSAQVTSISCTEKKVIGINKAIQGVVKRAALNKLSDTKLQ